MYRNPFWLIFLTLMGLAATGYTIHSLMKVYDFYRLDREVPVRSIQWSVETVDDEDYSVKADYSYIVGNLSYRSSAIWDEHFLNESTAEEKISTLTETVDKIWIDSAGPSKSAIQRKFPFRQCISTIFLWSIWLYFFWLGYYVNRHIQGKKIYSK